MSYDQGRAVPPGRLRYEGSGARIWGIALGNLGLNILTLGIWRFWGIVRVRRYIWAAIRFEGDSFEFAGTGGELFRGFLLALVLFGLPIAALGSAAEYLALDDQMVLAGLMQAAVYGFVLAMAAIGIYRARRYRLSRTRWRGIRGGLGGSSWAYLGRCALWLLATGLSLGLAYPWGRCVMTRYVWNQTEFGNLACTLTLPAGPLFRRWLAVWGLVAVYVAGLVGFGAVIVSDALGNPLPVRFYDWSAVAAVATLLMLPLAVWFYARYRAFELRAIAAGLRWGELRFRFDIRTGPFLWLIATNFLIVLLTLGIGVPYAMHRWVRFASHSLDIEGEQDFDLVLQNQSLAPRHGEGLVSLLDAE